MRTFGSQYRNRYLGLNRRRRQRRTLRQNWRDETVTAARNRLDVVRDVGIISEGVPHLPNSYAQAVIELDEGVLRPEALPHFFPSHHFPTPLHEHDQEPERKLLQFHALGAARKAALPRVEFERTKPVFECR